MYIGEPFYITKIYNIINKVDGVVDTTKVIARLTEGENYNSSSVTIHQVKSKDGTFLRAPRNSIYEIKNFNSDVIGRAI